MSLAPRRRAWWFLALAYAMAGTGCSQFSSRQRVEESRRYIQALRSENDQLKDQVLAYRNQNQDFSERAVDDARRLAVQADVIEGQNRSIHAYQAEREDFKTAFRQIRDSLPSAVRSAMSDAGSRVAFDAERDEGATPPTPSPAVREQRRKPVPTGHGSDGAAPGGWTPAAEEGDRDEPGLDPSP